MIKAIHCDDAYFCGEVRKYMSLVRIVYSTYVQYITSYSACSICLTVISYWEKMLNDLFLLGWPQTSLQLHCLQITLSQIIYLKKPKNIKQDKVLSHLK